MLIKQTKNPTINTLILCLLAMQTVNLLALVTDVMYLVHVSINKQHSFMFNTFFNANFPD